MAMLVLLERRRVSGEEAVHDRRQGDSPSAEYKVNVVREQGPRGARRPCCGQRPTQPVDEGRPVGVIPQDSPSLDPRPIIRCKTPGVSRSV